MNLKGLHSVFFLIGFLFLTKIISAQVIIKNFTALPANSSQLLISWTVGAGSQTCNDLWLYWSTDSFLTTNTLVYKLPTVCGASGSDESYSFQHTTPDANGKNYYRLTAFAAPVSLMIVYDFGAENGAYKLSPQPMTEGISAVLTFKNPQSDWCIMEIANANCTKRYTIQNITTGEVHLSADWFDAGIHFFRIYSLNKLFVKGKFIVIRD